MAARTLKPFAVIRNSIICSVHDSKVEAAKHAEWRNGKVFSRNEKELKNKPKVEAAE